MDPQALDLATKTLASAIDTLMAKGTPFTPIVFVMKGGQREARPLVVDKGEDAAAAAKQLAAGETDADATAYAVDGTILYDNSRQPGIIVEAWNFRTSRGARVGLRYEIKGLRKRPSLIGSPLHLGRGGWYDPEDGEPPAPTFPAAAQPLPAMPPLAAMPAMPVIPDAPAPQPAPVVDLDEGFGPPPVAAELAPSDSAPPPPPSAYGPPPVNTVEPPALPKVFSAAPADPPPAATPSFGPPPTASPNFGPPPAALPSFGPPTVVPEFGAPTAAPDFGPPPTSAPVPGLAPPEPALQSPAAVPAPAAPTPAAPTPAPVAPPAPILDTTPPTAVRAVDVPSPVAAPVPTPSPAPGYLPLTLQRNETPLGNRAMFAGVMELATRGRSFPAFAIVQKDGEWEQVTMTDASLAETAASVRAYARTRTDADFIAFAVDGFVSVDEVPVTAVVVEVWEYATRVSFSVAQRYIATGEPPTPRLSGRPLMRTQDGWVDVPSSMTLGGQVQFGYRDPDPV